MRQKFYFVVTLILILVLFQEKVSFGVIDDTRYLNVNLTKPLNNDYIVYLESPTGFSIYEENDKQNPIHLINEDSINCTINENGDISLKDLSENLLFTIPKDNAYLLYGNGIEENFIKIEEDRYRGYLKLNNIEGSIRVINHIEIEQYLYGLVPREMPSNFPLEALKAQAVAARTYAIHNMDKHQKDGYNLCDTTHCQVYSGYDGEKTSTTQAVNETKGLIATYNGETIDAQYHSTSSGYTNDSIYVWGGELPYLKSVKDEFSSDAPYSKWNTSINMNDLNDRIISYGIDIGELQKVEISRVSPNGNVENVILKGSYGDKEVKGSVFRNIVGNMDLKSTNFSIKSIKSTDNTLKNNYLHVIDGNRDIVSIDISMATVIDKYGRRKMSTSSNRAMSMNKVEDLSTEGTVASNNVSEMIIEGKGFGHGVGMSQYGAKKMAELGYDFEEILKYYYTGIDVLQKI